MKPKEKNEIFARKVPQGEKQQGLGLLYKASVKCTNQGKIVWL